MTYRSFAQIYRLTFHNLELRIIVADFLVILLLRVSSLCLSSFVSKSLLV